MSDTLASDRTMRFVTVAHVGDVPPGALLCVDFDGTPVTLANVDGEIYAFAAYCTHQRALLEEGELEGMEIICPWHAGSFDVRTGRALCPPAVDDLQTYLVRVDEEDIQLLREGNDEPAR